MMATKKKAKKSNAVRGRPTKDKPEFCEMLIEHMREGLSFEAFGGVIGCCKKTLYTWCDSNPDFLYAKNVGTEAGRLFWEKIAIDAMKGNGKIAVPAVWVFTMKNRFGWRDRQHEDTDNSSMQPIVIDLPASERTIEIKGSK